MVRMIEKEVGCVAILRMRIMAESNEHGHNLYIFARCVFECLIVQPSFLAQAQGSWTLPPTKTIEPVENKKRVSAVFSRLW